MSCAKARPIQFGIGSKSGADVLGCCNGGDSENGGDNGGGDNGGGDNTDPGIEVSEEIVIVDGDTSSHFTFTVTSINGFAGTVAVEPQWTSAFGVFGAANGFGGYIDFSPTSFLLSDGSSADVDVRMNQWVELEESIWGRLPVDFTSDGIAGVQGYIRINSLIP